MDILKGWNPFCSLSIFGKPDKYPEFLEKTGLQDYRRTEGNRGVFVLRNFDGDEAHFLLISLWASEEAIRKFAGADTSTARYYPGDEEYLLELEPTVIHYEVLFSP
jgi:heme-degrading monooxygenase HmoA